MSWSAEQKLVKRAINHDPEAFGELYDRYFRKIYTFIFYRVGSREEAEDLTAQVFLKALEKIDQFRWRGVSFVAWLFKIAVNLVTDYYRAKRAEEVPLEENCPKGKALEQSPEEQVLYQLDLERIKSLIAQLTQEQQQVVILRFLIGLSLKEVSQIMGKKIGAIKALQYRALCNLKELMIGAKEDAS
jgi:RNA polymerase sigma-70 factor (ECF subfamily)